MTPEPTSNTAETMGHNLAMTGTLESEIDRRSKEAKLHWILEKSYAAGPTDRYLHYDNPQGLPRDDELWWSGCVYTGDREIVAVAKAFGDESARDEVLRRLLDKLDSVGYR